MPAPTRHMAEHEAVLENLVHESSSEKKTDAVTYYGGPRYAQLLRVPLEENMRPLTLQLYANLLAGAMTQLEHTPLPRNQRQQRIEETRQALSGMAQYCLNKPQVLFGAGKRSSMTDWKRTSLIANAFSKAPDGASKQACRQIAARFRVVGDQELASFGEQNLTMLATAFSKLPDDRECHDALVTAARGIQRRAADKRLGAFNYDEVANLANAFSKLPAQSNCHGALAEVAWEVQGRGLKQINERILANLANAFSKQPSDPDCHEAIALVAMEVRHRAGGSNLRKFNEPELANLANAFCKLNEDADCADGIVVIAKEVVRRAGYGDLRIFSEQHLVNLANAFSKLGADDACHKALADVAREVAHRAHQSGLGDCDEQHLSILANAFSKLANNAACQDALAELAWETLQRLKPDRTSKFSEQSLANLSNAFCKLDDSVCQDALAAIGSAVAKRSGAKRMDTFEDQHLASLANALAKVCGQKDGDAGLAAVAREVRDRANKGGMKTCNEQHLSNLANAFSKLVNDTDCKRALVLVAAEARGRLGGVAADTFDEQHLSTLANSFSKLAGDVVCQDALVAVAAELRRRVTHGRAAKLIEQDLTNLANAFAKLVSHAGCQQGLATVAAEVLRRADNGSLDRLDGLDLSVLANAFSKLVADPACGSALVTVAKEVRRYADGDRMTSFDEQSLANLANALSKLLDESACRDGLMLVASAVRDRAADGRIGRFNTQELSSAAGAFSKLVEEQPCQQGLVAIAVEVQRYAGAHDLRAFHERELANLTNALSKMADDDQCRLGLVALATELQRRADGRGLSGFGELSLANLANGFSKLTDDSACQKALATLAREVSARLLDDQGIPFSERELSTLANALSKQADKAGFQDALAGLAKQVCERLDRADPATFAEPALAILANAFSKLDEEHRADEGLASVAREMLRRATSQGMGNFNEQDLATLANALSKPVDAGDCQAAIEMLAKQLLERANLGGLSKFNEQDLTQLANAFSKYITAPCRGANVAIARHLQDQPACLAQASGQSVSLLALAFARHLHEADAAQQAVLEGALRMLAPLAVDVIPESRVLAAANVLRAYSKARLYEEMRSVAAPALRRIESMLQADGLRGEDLETMGSLCTGLTPLVRSEELRRFRRDALLLLQQLRPVITRKLDLYLGGGKAAAPADELFVTRCPALSVYQILKAYVQVRGHWQGRYVGTTNVTAQAESQALDTWLRQVYERTAALIERDLSAYSWNMIAQMESEDPADALDNFLLERVDQIASKWTPAHFDHDSVFDAFDHAPRPPAAGAGLLAIPTVDPMGRVLQTAAPRYSLFASLTQSQIQPLWVQLPQRFSSFLLARTFLYNGQPYRFDLVGGSRMKVGAPNISQLFTPGEGKSDKGGMLLALPLAETLPGSAYGRMMAEMFPNEESFYYFQRALMGSPPALSSAARAQQVGLDVPGHVLEGRFRVALLPDTRPAGEVAHPFALTDARGRTVALRPFDGCGFIREEVARRMPAFEHALRYGKLVESANLPAQGLQHYGRQEEVADEVIERMTGRLMAHGADPKGEDVFRSLSAGLIKGDIGVAVPSSDDQVHLPQAKSAAFNRHGGDLLVGKSPYDKPNLGWFDGQQVRTDDATAEFLDRCTTLQYSFWIKAGNATGEAVKSFAKGLLIAIPHEMWPAAFGDVDMCLSADDVKMQSDWQNAKQRVVRDTRMAGPGQLQAGDLFAGGSLVALPPKAQQQRDGDFDGDPMLILAGYPKLAEDVRLYNEREQALGLPSLKPPKSHTPAIGDDGRYLHGRARAIMSMQLNVLTDFVGLQYLFLALPPPERERFVEQALFGVHEGWEPGHQDAAGKWQPGLRPLVGRLRDAETLKEKREALKQAAVMLRRQHDNTAHPQARAAAALLAQAVREWASHHVPGTPVGSLELAPPQIDESFERLFPGLRRELGQQSDAAARIDVLLKRVPNRVPMPGQHWQVPGDAIASFKRLLSMGVKIGTDALKSNTGTKQARRTADFLRGLYSRMYGGMQPPPYTKLLARQLHEGRFDARAALDQLVENPTLAAQIMEKAIARLQQKKWLAGADEPVAGEGGARRLMTAHSFDAVPDDRSRNRRQLDGVARGIRTRAFELEKEVTPVLSDLLAQLGGREHHPADRLKSGWSIKDKIGRAHANSGEQGVTQEQADACVLDGLRYALVFEEAGFTDKVLQALKPLRSSYGIERIKNTFVEGATYKGINIVLRDNKSGVPFEIQFHTEASVEVKRKSHATYRKSLNPHLREAEREALFEKLRDHSATIVLPDGVDQIKDFTAGFAAAEQTPAGRSPGVDTTATRARPAAPDAGRGASLSDQPAPPAVDPDQGWQLQMRRRGGKDKGGLLDRSAQMEGSARTRTVDNPPSASTAASESSRAAPAPARRSGGLANTLRAEFKQTQHRR